MLGAKAGEMACIARRAGGAPLTWVDGIGGQRDVRRHDRTQKSALNRRFFVVGVGVACCLLSSGAHLALQVIGQAHHLNQPQLFF